MWDNFKFVNETSENSSYISLILGDNIINYQLEMLTNNSIRNLLEAKKIRKNNDIKVSYDVTSKISLDHILSRGKMSKNKFLLLLKGFVNACEELPEYQLVGAGILLDRKYIYINPDTNEPYFVYIPLSENEIDKREIKEFFTKIIIDGCIEVSQDNFVQRFLEMINSDNVSVLSIKNFLKIYSEERVTINPMPINRHISGGNSGSVINSDKKTTEDNLESKNISGKRVTEDNLESKNILGKKAAEDNPKQKNISANSKNGKGGAVRFFLVQIGIIIIIAGVISQGLLKDLNGNIKMEMAVGLGILLVLGDILAYKYMILANKDNGSNNNSSNGITYVKASDISKNKVPPISPVIKREPPDIQDLGDSYDDKNIEFYKKDESIHESFQNNKKSNFDAIDDESDLTICDDMDEKTELMSDKTVPYLVYVENGMPIKINLKKESTVIGRKRDSVDYVISSGKVGRVHAEILYIDSKCYIRDCNSRNGSYINNGSRLQGDTKFEIRDGDIVRLADVEMILHIL